MMAGTGVSSGGAGMLRARRRDVSVKPNRKLDRKSSRGMIYENEELRLRTIHINAEVEQGQNDIKKLRRENEQLRREIWSLRDEYDKLEEILKSQKNREGSEEYEDRSEGDDKDDDEEADDGSDYSGEEDEEKCDEEEEDDAGDDGAEAEERDQEERLENAENQKISSEKMNNSLHRLHVEFDDLSVVDEEEEVKRDKERKDAVSPEEKDIGKSSENGSGPVRIASRNGYPCFPAQYQSPLGQNYYPGCSYPCEAGFSNILPINPASITLTPCPTAYDGSAASVPNFDTPGISFMPPRYEDNHQTNRMTYGSPIGWQDNIFSPRESLKMTERYQAGVMAAQTSGICAATMFAFSEQSDSSAATTTSTVCVPHETRIDEGTWTERLMSPIGTNRANVQTLLQRRNILLKQPNCSRGETKVPSRVGFGGFEAPSSAETLTRNGWDFSTSGSIAGNRGIFCDTNDNKNEEKVESERSEAEEIAEGREAQHKHHDLAKGVSYSASTDRPKHFFAPLPLKIQHGRQDSGDKAATGPSTNPTDSPSMAYLENFGTGRSSSSDRTNSTVISAQNFPHTFSVSGTGNISDGGDKGSADICVNGAVPAYGYDQRYSTISERRIYKSSENLLMGNEDISCGNSSSRQGSNNPLSKSISCQDLTSEQLHNSLLEVSRTFNGDNKSQKLTKSDNTLDNNPVGGSPKPFRSQLNVTLKLPHRRDSLDTPEIPKLPSIDYRLFNNQFLKMFDPSRVNYGNCGIGSPVTKPLSIRVNENSHEKTVPQLGIDYSSATLTHSFSRRLNPEETTGKSTMRTSMNDVGSDRHRVLFPSSTNQPIDPRIISSPKLRQEFQVTSFEQPNPRSLLPPGLTAFDLESLRRMPTASTTNPIISSHQKLYQNVPFVPGGAPTIFCSPGENAMRMLFDNQTLKVPAQTQTSIDGGSNHEDELDDGTMKDSKVTDPEDPGTPSSPTSTRRKRTIRKGRSNQTTDKRPLSPAAQRRKLRKQSSINVGDGIEPNKAANKPRKFSPATTTTTTTDHLEDKNESRSSSSGQESPRKDHNRRVSLYFNNKKRPSLTSVKTTRSGSIDNNKDGLSTRGGDPLDTTNSERERTNSASSREAAGGKARKSSVSSGKVPWCACWGNGCI